nr:acetyltransferase [Vibrio cholerae]
MVSVVVFEFSVMRCQPLRRALADFRHPNKRICA